MSPVDTPYVNKANWVVNLSSRSLSDAEKALLKKGPNFAVTPANIPATENIAKVEAAVRQLDAEGADTVRRAVNGILQQADPPEPNNDQETQQQESRATADHRGSKSLSEQQGSKCTNLSC